MNTEYSGTTAGSLANKEVPTCKPDDTVGTVLSFIRELAQTYQSVNYIYVLDGRTLVGVFSIHELMCADSNTHISEIMTRDVAYAHIQTDKEQVAELALAQSVKAVPVIDDNKEFVGVISSDVILRVLHEEHMDDLYKSAGIQMSVDEAYQRLSIFRRVRGRVPWLTLGLLGGFGAAIIVNFFEETIATQIALAAFIPAIVYVGDAVGNQSEMLFIRWLTNRTKISTLAYLLREWVIGTLIGVFLAAIMFAVSFVWLHHLPISIILALTIMATVYISITITVVLPWFFQKLGYDPAVASGPLATVLCDIASLCVYLVIASAIL